MHNINELIEFDTRHSMFRTALRFVDYELIPGDIFEFGSYTGRSLALLSHYHQVNRQGIHHLDFSRRVVAFDSFEGLPGGDNHPRWKAGMFRVNHSYHPICQVGERVTPDVIRRLFAEYQLPAPEIEVGLFSQTLPQVIPAKYESAAVIHIDCDLYQSTKSVLEGMEPIFQEGTILLFDDWFNFKGNKNKGEQKAFWEFSANQTKWSFIPYQAYATFGNSFIVSC